MRVTFLPGLGSCGVAAVAVVDRKKYELSCLEFTRHLDSKG